MPRVLLALASVALAALPAVGQLPPRVEICDLFRDAPAWNGKMVSVTGPIQAQPGSHEGGPWIAAENCAIKILVKGQAFENTINIATPSLPKPLVDHVVNFKLDQAAWNQLDTLLLRMDRATEDILATVIGLFETRVPLDELVTVNATHPEGRRTGYGHLGYDPAQIIVETIKDMRLEKKQSNAK